MPLWLCRGANCRIVIAATKKTGAEAPVFDMQQVLFRLSHFAAVVQSFGGIQRQHLHKGFGLGI